MNGQRHIKINDSKTLLVLERDICTTIFVCKYLRFKLLYFLTDYKSQHFFVERLIMSILSGFMYYY